MRSNWLWCAVLVVNTVCHDVDNRLTEIIMTEKGPVQGEIIKTVRKSVEYSSFRGIRYGKPPVGYYRFKAPQEADNWSETFQAISDGNPCLQLVSSSENTVIGSEDCLNVNIYTPKTNFSGDNATNLPVMVWIYGGRLSEGSNNRSYYGPDFLIENGVVVVSMNYRLTVFGFLALNLPNATGNAGLKDQLLALKWVQKNIRAFGGDPDSVTIFGTSAGGLSVDYHVLSDASQGLFHRSISMSGSPLCPWGFFSASEAEAQAFVLARKLGIFIRDKEALLEALYDVPAEDLALTAATMSIILPPFRPVIEDRSIAGSDAFLTKCIIGSYQSGNFSQLPHLMGFMANESIVFLTPFARKIQSMDFALEIFQKIQSTTLVDVRSTFPALNSQAKRTDDIDNALINDASDFFFISGIDSKHQMLVNYSSAPVYYYKNSFMPEVSVHKLRYGFNRTVAAHGDDDVFVWHVSTLNFPRDPSHPFVIMQDRIAKMWTNFAKYSDPTPLGTCDPVLNITWPESGAAGTHLQIDAELSVGRFRPTRSSMKIYQRAFDAAAPQIYQCVQSSAGYIWPGPWISIEMTFMLTIWLASGI